jgi:hypothetical protein
MTQLLLFNNVKNGQETQDSGILLKNVDRVKLIRFILDGIDGE